MNQIEIKYVKNLHPIFTKNKRIKIIVGGRGSTKSTGIADYVAAKMSVGELWCCARETQNSIAESVHRNLLEEIERLGINGFTETKTSIEHYSGGRAFYAGLSRNITSLKSTLSGIDGLWIEEGEDITDNTLRVLTASVRLNATDTIRLIAGEDVKLPEIIITMNRGTRSGAVARKWLARAEKALAECGYYEDDTLMVVQMNYTDMPKKWFEMSGLEQERLDDFDKLARSEYDHKWNGSYFDTVASAIIKPEWFDAAVDAHLIPHLEAAFKPLGAKKVAHDPFDDGNDAGGYASMHGSIITQVKSKTKGEIDEVMDWATDLAITYGADWFIWDGDGMGTGLKRQVSTAFNGKPVQFHMFRGSLSGTGQDNAKRRYMATDFDSQKDQKTKLKTYAETFKNNRAQYYIRLADRFYNTYRCVVRGEYVDPEDMISLNSEGIDNIIDLKSQLCRIPRKPNGSGLQQIMNKTEMKSNGIDSPNEGDSVMMLMFTPTQAKIKKPVSVPQLRRLS